jgi:GNAT superfamily N-acetyltransferase
MTGLALLDGSVADLHALATIDPLISGDAWRERLVRLALASAECVVAFSDDAAVGYAVCDHGFYGRGWIQLLLVAAEHRRRGIGDALLAACEERCRMPAIFVSTNASNAPMRALLARRGYVESGTVEGLDDGDPEVFYRKALPR